jgi:hypothetical protein
MTYEYSDLNKVLDLETPLVTRTSLLLGCKEIDEDTPETETISFINSAHVLVCNTLDGYGISTTLITEIERNLAAHFAVLAYPSVQREQIGPMSNSFFGKLGTGLENTRYGQSAIAMDPTGILKEFSDGKRRIRVRMTSLGSGIIAPVTSG